MTSNIPSNRRIGRRALSVNESFSQLAPLDIALYRAVGVSLWQWQRLYRPLVRNARSLLVPATPGGWRDFVQPLLAALATCRGQARGDSLAADAGERWIYALTVAVLARSLLQQQGPCRLRGPGGELWSVFCGAPSRLGLKKAQVLDREERHSPEEAFILLPYLAPACGLSWLLEEYSVWRALLSFVSDRGGALSIYAAPSAAASVDPSRAADAAGFQSSLRPPPASGTVLAVAEPVARGVRRQGAVEGVAWQPGAVDEKQGFGRRTPRRRDNGSAEI